MNENEIRIMDGSGYNELFRMHEGENLTVEKDGETVEYGKLKYIDSTHFGTDKGHIFHIAQFGQYVIAEGWKVVREDVS